MAKYNSFQELAYINKVGHKPANSEPKAKKEAWKGNWDLVYQGKILTYNKPYAICARDLKQYGMQAGYNKALFQIKPCKA